MPVVSKQPPPWTHTVVLGFVLIIALWLRLPGLTAERFHEDEAIYSAWALQSATGQDIGFDHTAIDKPPIFLALLSLAFRVAEPTEATARWPNLIAGLLIVALTFRLGHRLYDRRTGLLAATVVAISPFAISFGPTVFTDPWMVVFVLCSLEAAAAGRAEFAGLFAGLGTMTKPTAPLFLPLIVAVLLLFGPARAVGRPSPDLWWPALRRFLLGFGLVIAIGLAWDGARHQRPGFLFYGAGGYGGLSLAQPANWGTRLSGWLRWLSFFAASAWVNVLAVGGIAGLLLRGVRRGSDPRVLADRLLAGFLIFYLLTQWVFTFHVWDRYLLGLVPLAALLLSRAFIWPPKALAKRWSDRRSPQRTIAYSVAVTLFLVIAMLPQAVRASRGGYPVGGDHGAYQGIDQVATYLRQDAPADSIVFHYRLRRHFAYYLYGTPFDFRWYSTPDSLAAQAAQSPGKPRYVVIPDWRDSRPLAAALTGNSMRWQVTYQTRRRDGTISFTLYRITGPPPS